MDRVQHLLYKNMYQISILFHRVVTHCEGMKHCKIANSDTLKNVQKIETYLKKRILSENRSTTNPVTESNSSEAKCKKTSSCPVFF